MPTATRPRFVNLNKTRTYVPGPDGGQVAVMPFEDTFHDKLRKDDAVYVVEGDWWRQFVGSNGPLFPFPAPREFGRESFPALVGTNYRISAVPVPGDVDGGAGDAGGASVAVAARMGRPRLAGDVITPEGKIRKTDPATGKEILVDDTPENRHMVHTLDAAEQGRPAAVPTEDPNAPLKRSIIDTLEEMGIESYHQFAELSDEALLRVPGVNSQNLPMLRKNIGDLLKRIDAKARETDGEDEDDDELGSGDPTPVGETVRTDPRASEDQTPAPSEAATRRKKATKRKGAKKPRKPAKPRTSSQTKKKAAKKTTSRKPATD